MTPFDYACVRTRANNKHCSAVLLLGNHNASVNVTDTLFQQRLKWTKSRNETREADRYC